MSHPPKPQGVSCVLTPRACLSLTPRFMLPSLRPKLPPAATLRTHMHHTHTHLLFIWQESSGLALPMGSRTLSAPSSTSNYPARGRAGSPRAGEMSWAGSTVHTVNSNRSRILGNIRLAWFVVSLNLEIGFLRVKSGFLKGQVSPSI